MAQFDPSKEDVDTVLKHLSKADAEERDRVLTAEKGGKKRKTVLEKYGIDPDARYDASGRQLYPWEVTGEDMADADRQPAESEEQRKLREAQAEHDATVASTPQLGSTPASSGTAPAPTTGAGAGITGGTTTATSATGTAGA